MKTCDYCGGSGRDAVTPQTASCWKCHGTGSYWEADPAPSSSSGGRSSGHSGTRGSYSMLEWTEDLLESIPRWLNWSIACVGLVFGYWVVQQSGPANSMAIVLSSGFFALLGFASLRIGIVVLDLVIQLSWGLVKIAVALGIFAGILYIVSLLLR